MWFDWLVKLPASFIGSTVGTFFHFGWMLASLAIGIFAGRLVYLNVRFPYLRAVLAGVVGIYVLIVVGEAESHFAAAMFRAMEDRDEY